MDRRKFIKTATLAGGTAGLAGLSAPALASDNQTWRMVTCWPKGFPGLGTGARRLAERITRASNGRLTIKVYSAGELVPPFQALDAVMDGAAEMSHSTPYYWQNKSLALNFFAGLPYGMTMREQSAWVHEMGGQELWDEIYSQFGVQGFLCGNSGNQAGGWFRKEINSLEDVKGLRFRTPGFGGRVWETMGATVTNIPVGEVFSALKSGTLDAAEFASPYNDLALGFYQAAQYYYLSSFNEPGQAVELVVSKEKFESLSEDLQQIVRDACQAELDQVTNSYFANDPRALKTLIDDHGVQVRQFPEDIKKAGAEAARNIYAELLNSEDPLTQKTANSFVDALRMLRTRSEGNEGLFIDDREKYFTI